MSRSDPPSQATPSPFRRLLRSFHPAAAGPGLAEMARIALGCGLAAGLCGGAILLLGLTGPAGLFLLAPFGASAFLVVAVPNSPLAQPWPVFVGSVVPALIGLGVAQLLPASPLAVAVALAASVAAMAMLRAMHPPGGAMAVFPVLAGSGSGLAGLLVPVALESLLLILFALIWHRLTGRVYPYRQPDEAPRAAPGFSRAELGAILGRLRLSSILGVADFARLLAAADEVRRADVRVAGLSCADAAGPMPPVLGPGDGPGRARDLMLSSGARTLPVCDAAGRLTGVVTQSDLLRAGLAGMEGTVSDLMTAAPVTLPAAAPLQQALTLLAARNWRAVPLTDGQGHCCGMLTRPDLLAVLARPPAP